MKKNIISILCPSRNRSAKIIPLIDSICKSASTPQRIEVLFYVDNNDPDLETYKQLFENGIDDYKQKLSACELTIGPPISVSKSWNTIANKSTGELLMMGNDDQIFVTHGWDTRLDEESLVYPDKIFCMWFNDGIQGPDHCAFPIVSRKWCDTLGYFTPGVFRFLFNDTWVMDLAKRVGRLHYIPDVLVEHHHWTAKGKQKSSLDDTYNKHISGANSNYELDKELFHSEKMELRRQADAKKLHNITQNILISLICPTRGRPKKYRTYLQSILDTVSDPDLIEIVSYVDDDDKEMLDQLDAILSEFPTLKVKFLTGTRLPLSAANQKCSENCRGLYLMLNGDDVIYRTPNWDVKFVDAFQRLPAGIGLVFADDGAWHSSFSVFPCVSKTWIETLGYLCTELFPADFDDTWIFDIATKLDSISLTNRIIYLDDVLIEHMHHSLGKADFDLTYKELEDKKRSIDPDGMFFALESNRQLEAEKLLAKSEQITGCDYSATKSLLPIYQKNSEEVFTKKIPNSSSLTEITHVNLTPLKSVKTILQNNRPRTTINGKKRISSILHSLLETIEEKSLWQHFDCSEEEINGALTYSTCLANNSAWGAFHFDKFEDRISNSSGCSSSYPNSIQKTTINNFRERFFTEFAEVIHKSEKFILFGAGKHAEIILQVIKKMHLQEKLIAIADDNAQENKFIGNIPVLKPSDIEDSFQYVIISSDFHEKKLAKRASEVFTEAQIICPYSFVFNNRG